MPPNQLSITMAAVAREAGVSRATASRVLNGDTRVDPSSAKRVRQAAAKLGYVRNAAAAQLARRQSNLIGLLLRDATNPAYSYLQDALIRRAKERNLFLVTVSTGSDDIAVDQTFAETSSILRFLELRPAAIIVASGMIGADDVATIAAQVPTLVMPRPETREGLYCVGYDEETNARLIANLVADRGHRRVAVLHNSPSNSQVEATRGRVMEETLRTRGVDVLALRGHILTHDPDVLAQQIAEEVRAGLYTCVMFPNDTRAVQFLVRSQALGLDVPGDVSVTGLDGLGNAVALAGLATVRNPIEQAAQSAIDLVEAFVRGDAAHFPLKQVFAGTLVDGQTLGAVMPPEAPGARGSQRGAARD